MAAELGQQTVDFSALVRRAAEESFLALKDLIDRSKSADQRESDKKIELLKYVAKTRQRMLRLHVLAKWCQQVPLVQYCQQLASTLSSHDTCFTQAADSLFFVHEGLQQARAPIYDVPSSIEILLTGSYERLPKCIEDLGLHSTLSEKEQKPALKKLDSVIRSKLLELTLPKEISEVKVSNGTLQVQVDGEFKVVLTLGYRGHLSLWRILHMELLVGEKNGTVKLEETRRYVLGDDLERRMAGAENPFTTLYSILHELCVALVMDTVIRQAQVLRVSRWKDAIRLDLVTESSSGGGNVKHLQYTQDSESESGSLKTPGLKISYWLDFHKGAGGSDHGSFPYLKIEPGSDLVIKCLHSTFVLDRFSNTEAEFSLIQQCIDVEKLLLRAIACNKHTRLLEIYRELCNNTQICQTPSDVILQQRKGATETDKEKEGHLFGSDDHYEDEVLRVRAYGSMYITLGISIRSGRFVLKCSKNIFESSVLADREESLNQSTLTAAEVFTNLRSKSILHLFASTGSFLGLQVYEQGLPTLRIPKGILNEPNCLLMGFPQCGSSYFLVMQLDKNFKPLFKLLDTQPGPGEVATSVESDHVVRFNNIDISNMELIEDELNLSLLNWDKLHLFSPGEDTAVLLSEQNILHAHDSTLETALQCSAHPNSSFSSIVDEVFDFEKGLSASALPIQNKLSSFNSPLQSQTSSLHGVKLGRSPNMWGRELSYSGSAKPSSGGLAIHNSSYRQDDSKGSFFTGSLASSSSLRGSSSAQDLARSKSEQDLSAGRSPVMSPPQVSGSRIPVANTKQSGPKMTTSNQLALYLESVPTVSKTAAVCNTSGCNDVAKQYKSSRKRSISEVLPLIPSLLGSNNGTRKKRKIVSSAHCYPITSDKSILRRTHHVTRYTYGSLLADANQVDPNVYLSSLLHVVRHCSLCIKHARLTSQMDAIEIPYVEEVGRHSPSSNLWFRLPFTKDDSWHRICLHLGKPGSMCWDVKLNDSYFKELWELQKGSANTMWGCGVRIANSSDIDSHIRYHPDGVVLSYKTVESDSIQKLVSDLQRLFNARLFACGMRKLLAVKADKTLPDGASNDENKMENATKVIGEPSSKLLESIQRPFKIEAVGLMSLWFCYGTMPVTAHFVVEWEAGKEGCTMHVSPDQLWPHTKFLEDFINGGEVASFLDCVRLTAGPLISLGNAVRPARVPIPVASIPTSVTKQNGGVQSQGVLPNTSSSNISQPASTSVVSGGGPLASHSLHGAAVLSAAGRGGPGIVPSSLLPIDVSVVLRGPYWIRIIYRKKFAVDMRCYAGDQVWLQPATPPKDGPAIGGSLPCPQFRPFIMEHVAQGLNSLENSFTSGMHAGGSLGSNSASSNPNSALVGPSGGRATSSGNLGAPRPPAAVGTQGVGGLSRIGNSMLASSALGMSSGLPPIRISPGAGVPVHVKGELNTAFIGLGDDGGYGGGWVPLAALKKVLRGILKYLGVLWLFAQLPELLKDILGSILKDNEGTLLNLDQEQPALRFFVGTYVFAVSVHRVQLLLQVLSVKRFHNHQQQPQQPQAQSNSQEEFTSTEINEMCDYFSRRVASEPYDTSRVASFITLLTLPISVLRDFLKLIAWEKVLSQGQGGDAASSQRPRVELCLEKHSGTVLGENAENPSITKSNIRHDRPHSSVEFALTFVLDSSLIPHVNAAGGAAWLPYCVSVRLKYSFGENPHLSLVGIDGSHGGKACWPRLEDWDKCKQRIARAVDYGNGNSSGDTSQGRLRFVAETMQRSLQGSLQQIRDTSAAPVTTTT